MTLFSALVFGLVLGVRHATDPDHVAAVGTIAGGGGSGERPARRAALLGAAWGAGHSVSVLLVGGALVLWRLPMPARLALALEFLVAIMLVALGVRALTSRGRQAGQASVSPTRPMIIGVVHGLAGSAVLAFLVIGATSSALTATVYLACFCLGTIVGMALITGLLTLPARWSGSRTLSIDRAVRMTAGVASVAIGVWIAHRVGVRDGLFAATPTWTP